MAAIAHSGHGMTLVSLLRQFQHLLPGPTQSEDNPMNQAPRIVLAFAAAATLAACGGGADSPSQPLADSQPTRARAMATQAISNDQLFQWAQLTYPSLFGSATPAVIANYPFQGLLFDVRDYGNGNYLGVSNGKAYGYGNFTNFQLVDYGAVQDFAAQVCSVVNCGGGTGGGGSGALNECIDPAMSSLPTGARTTAVYVYSGLISGEQTVESVITGPSTFKGQSAVLVTSTTQGTNTATVGGVTSTTTARTLVKSYEQPGTNGLINTLGSVIEATTTVALPSFPGLPPLPGTETTTIVESVFNPPSQNVEFTLQLGQSVTKTEKVTTTTLAGPVITPPFTNTTSQTHTFEAKETITVPAGTYSTCRYRVADAAGGDATTSWLIVGKGIMAKSQSVTAQGTQTIELKSGTYNGGRL